MRAAAFALLLCWTCATQAQSCDVAGATQRVLISAADVALALPSSALPNALTLTAGDHALSVENATGTVSAFVLELPIDALGDATLQAQALIARMNTQMATLGATAVQVASSGRSVLTHDARDAKVQIHVTLPLSAAADQRSLRNLLMAVLSNHVLADFGGLIGPSGLQSSSYTLQMSVTLRADARMVVVGALAATATFNDNGLAVASEVGDYSDGSPLALAFNQFVAACTHQNAIVGDQVDLLVGTYTGGNMDASRPNTTALSLSLFDTFVPEGYDLRVGVVPHTETAIVQGAGNGGDLRSGFQRLRTQFETDLNNVSGQDGCNNTLTATHEAIAKALPRSAAGVDDALKLRADAQFLVLYLDVEHAQEIEQNVCGRGNLGTGQTDNARTTPNVAQQLTIDTIVAPFVARLLDNNAFAFGLLQALQATFCAGLAEDGRGYAEVIAATGGSFARVCDSDASAVLPGMLSALRAGDAVVAKHPPISSSLRLVRIPNGGGSPVDVPRSRIDGFEFERASNRIVIHGATHRPAVGDELRVSYRVWNLFANGFE